MFDFDYIHEDVDDELNDNDEKCFIEFREIIHETDMAYLIGTNNKGKFWIPKSICEFDKDVIVYPQWFDIKFNNDHCETIIKTNCKNTINKIKRNL